MPVERPETRGGWAARTIAVLLLIGGLAAIIVPFYLSFARDWPDDVYERRLILGGVTAALMGLGLFIEVVVLLTRRKADEVLRTKVLYSTFWGGPVGWVWSVFLLTRSPTADC
jgi:hypothetical protein